MNKNALQFAEQPASAAGAVAPWTVLVVDDDPDVHGVTRLMLQTYRFQERPLQLLHAYSAAEGKALLARHPGTALLLLDVVMESEHAGLDLVHHVRRDLGNGSLRILLRTGQPGQAPPQRVVVDYDIDDYLPKAELRFQRLHVVVTAALRTYALLRRLETQETELRRSNEELARLAYRDPLTGLINRRRFERALESEWQRALRQRLPLTALMIDVDCFKPYNDNYGHLAGDEVLRQVAAVLGAQFASPGESACRYGGEEFLVLLPGAAAADGLARAELLRAQVESLQIAHAHSPHRVLTVSVGCGYVQPAHNETLGPVRLVQAADEALYRAKQWGRNRVESRAAGELA